MASRLSLHKELIALMPKNAQHVYFQPPESIKLEYPCIIYARSSGDIKYADNMAYKYLKSYDITVIDKDPDSMLVDVMYTKFPMTRFNRHYVSDNLNHDVFTVYY